MTLARIQEALTVACANNGVTLLGVQAETHIDDMRTYWCGRILVSPDHAVVFQTRAEQILLSDEEVDVLVGTIIGEVKLYMRPRSTTGSAADL